MSERKAALKRRIVPSVPLVLDLTDDSGAASQIQLRLCFDFNAIALFEERTGIGLLNGEVWQLLHPDARLPIVKGSIAKALSVMLWAASLAHHPEYDSEDGLVAISSYMDAGNSAAISETLTEAFIASLPKKRQEELRAVKDQETRPLKPAARDAGSTSGPLPGEISESATKHSAA